MAVKLANKIAGRALSWLWPDMLPAGKLAILDGDPDLGKSLIALDLCARLSTGRPFPDGGANPGPANALVLSAEDSPHDTIVPRLESLGADMGRVAIWERDGEDEGWPWRFPRQANLLDEALTRTGARLAVIDPIMAFLDDCVLFASDQSVRRALAPLIHVADKHGCTLLMHRHLNKQGNGRALYRGMGSIAFLATCRFAMLVARDPLAPSRCVLAPVRYSLSQPPPSLAYRIRKGPDGLPAIDWLGPSARAADDLLIGPSLAHRGPRERAAYFLEQFLADGPRTSTDVWTAARRAGLSDRTVQRAKKAVDVRMQQVQIDGKTVTYCRLPHQVVLTGNQELDDFSRRLAELEKQYPSRTPLDDDADLGIDDDPGEDED
jgi:hypothetical protein